MSGERLRAELEKLFEEAPLGLDPARALRLLADWHVLAAIEPGLELPAASAAPLRRLGRAIAEPPWEGERARPLLCGLMLWFGELPAPLRRASLARLAVEGAPAAAVSAFPATRDRLLRSLGASRGRGACDALLAPLGAELLLALYASAAPAVRRRIVRWAREDRSEPLPIRGDELVALGLRGQAVGAALARLRAAWLDRAVRTPEDLLGLAQELARRSRVAHTRRASPRKPRSSAE